MNVVTIPVIEAFERALVKEALSLGGKVLSRAAGAAVPGVQSGARRILNALGSPVAARTAAGAFGGAGAGALGGAALGAGEGALAGYQEAKGQGQGLLDSLATGAVGSLRGALRRGGEGALAGAALGGVGSAMHAGLPGLLAKAPGVGAGARFGERQLHGLTGWTPPEGLRSIRGGAWSASKGLEDAAQRVRSAQSSGKGVDSARKALEHAERGLEASSKAEGMGLTSIPGYARSLAKHPIDTLKAGFGEQWAGQTPMGKATTVGLTGLGVANEVKGRDAQTEGAAESAGKALGGALPWMMGPLPTAAGLALTPAMALAGGLAGKGVDVLRRRRNPGSPPAPGPNDIPEGASQGTEHVYSDRAMGAPEGFGG